MDNLIQNEFPPFVYHGTLSTYLDSFQTKLLNRDVWKPNRDFGSGLYTTISLDQAKEWAEWVYIKLTSTEKKTAFPCVLKIGFSPDRAKRPLDITIFWSESLKWAKYIMDHRMNLNPLFDPCIGAHSDIIVGPMADGDTGKIVQDAVQYRKDHHWFLKQIIRNEAKVPLDTLRLGNQIVFAKEDLAPMLKLTGFHILEKEEWNYHGIPKKEAQIRQL
jgi:hypothetical protein